MLDYLVKKKKHREAQMFIYRKVNDFVKDNEKYFKGKSFASQWGTIRSIVMQKKTEEEIKKALYEDNANGYLVHGVAQSRWEESNRRKKLEDFIKDEIDGAEGAKYGDILCEALVNLCSEMAKACKKGERDNE